MSRGVGLDLGDIQVRAAVFAIVAASFAMVPGSVPGMQPDLLFTLTVDLRTHAGVSFDAKEPALRPALRGVPYPGGFAPVVTNVTTGPFYPGGFHNPHGIVFPDCGSSLVAVPPVGPCYYGKVVSELQWSRIECTTLTLFQPPTPSATCQLWDLGGLDWPVYHHCWSFHEPVTHAPEEPPLEGGWGEWGCWP